MRLLNPSRFYMETAHRSRAGAKKGRSRTRTPALVPLPSAHAPADEGVCAEH